MTLSNNPGLSPGSLMHASLVSKQPGQMSSRGKPIRAATLQMSENVGNDSENVDEEDPAANIEKILLNLKEGKLIFFDQFGFNQRTSILKEVSPFFKDNLKVDRIHHQISELFAQPLWHNT